MLVTKGTIKNLESKLLAQGFVSPSRGILVNISKIKSLSSSRILLKNGTELPIRRRRFKDIEKIYANQIIKIIE